VPVERCLSFDAPIYFYVLSIGLGNFHEHPRHVIAVGVGIADEQDAQRLFG
jgi:hypothetical protein